MSTSNSYLEKTYNRNKYSAYVFLLMADSEKCSQPGHILGIMVLNVQHFPDSVFGFSLFLRFFVWTVCFQNSLSQELYIIHNCLNPDIVYYRIILIILNIKQHIMLKFH